MMGRPHSAHMIWCLYSPRVGEASVVAGEDEVVVAKGVAVAALVGAAVGSSTAAA